MPSTKPAAAHEALGESIPVDFRGVSLLILPSSEWPFEALEAFEEGKVATFLRLILGKDQYAEVRKVTPKVGDARDLVEAIQDALGISGN